MALTQVTKELIKNIDPSQLNQAGALDGHVLTYSTGTNTWGPSASKGGGPGGSGNEISINGASLAKAWVNFNGSGGVGSDATIRSSYNISKVTKVNSGIYTIYFSNPFSDTNYVVGGMVGGGSVSYNNTISIYNSPLPATGSCTIYVDRGDGGSGSGSGEDAEIINVVFYANGGNITGNVVDNTPVGIVNWFASPTPPTGYLECNGAAVSRSTYNDLDAAIYCGNANNGTAKFGYRCTSTINPTGTRNVTGQYIVLPDLRGEFIRGWDDGKGTDTGRVFGSNQSDDFKSHSHIFSGTASNAIVTPSQVSSGDSYEVGKTMEGGRYSDGSVVNNLTIGSTGGTETRPRNVALLPCIKAQKTFSTTGVIPAPGLQLTDFTGSNQSLNDNGYQKLPGGLIMQWGVLDTTGTGTATVNFPLTFPNKCFNVVGTQKATSIVTSDIIGIGTITNSSVVFWFSTNADGAGSAKVYWQAFGN